MNPWYHKRFLHVLFGFFLVVIIFGCSKEKGPIYQLGSVITFGQGGPAQQYQKAGWSGPEAGFTWTDGSSHALEK